jgi:predicted phosphodiesterase
MRIAALYDIHGNLPALEAVLAELDQASADLIVVGGDAVVGPMPQEVLDCLLNLDVPVQFILGNAESEVLAQMRGETVNVPEPFREGLRWVADQLYPAHEQQLASWPLTFSTRVAGLGEVLFCHATPRNNTEIFTRLTPEDRLLPVFVGTNAAVVVCGHTHMQFDRMVGRTRVINAGSVGMPYANPGAYWLLLGPDIQLRQTPYELGKAAERIKATHYPQAEDFAEINVLNPPSEAGALEVFGKAELK